MKGLALIVSLLFFMALFSSFNNQADTTFSLTIDVHKLRNSKGMVQFALCNKDGSFPDESFKKYYKILRAEIANNSSQITMHNIPKGEYAVHILHDENSNGKIDKGFFLPIEGIGFSNHKTIQLSKRPNFENASFLLDRNKEISVIMIYL